MAFYDGWGSYVSAAERRRKAMRAAEQRRKQGSKLAPVSIAGRTIASTFWGKSWCENLERYSDYANRLPRGRTYARNGSVIDLQIKPGVIEALVSGSRVYEIRLKITPASKQRWKAICDDCSGAIESLVELLQGRFSKSVMERICKRDAGLFPAPAEIALSCSCPDWADMCKHVAAVLYSVGARLDQQPELLFRLRGVDEKDLIATAGAAFPLTKKTPASAKVLDAENLSDIFGLDIAASAENHPIKKRTVRKAQKSAAKRAATKKMKRNTAPVVKRSVAKSKKPRPK